MRLKSVAARQAGPISVWALSLSWKSTNRIAKSIQMTCLRNKEKELSRKPFFHAKKNLCDEEKYFEFFCGHGNCTAKLMMCIYRGTYYVVPWVSARILPAWRIFSSHRTTKVKVVGIGNGTVRFFVNRITNCATESGVVENGKFKCKHREIQYKVNNNDAARRGTEQGDQIWALCYVMFMMLITPPDSVCK